VATRVCDVKPCERLTWIVQHILWDAGHPDEVKNGMVEVDVVARGAKNPIPLALDYCPFCGTRISEGLRKHVQQEW
jgi:hypothetical protein